MIQRLGVAQFGSVLEWGSRGRKFESSHPDQTKSLNLYGLGIFCFLSYAVVGKKHTKKHTGEAKTA